MKRFLILSVLALCIAAGASYAKEDATKPSMVYASDYNIQQSQDIEVLAIQDKVGITEESVTIKNPEYIIENIADVELKGVFHPPDLTVNILATINHKPPSTNLKFYRYLPKGVRCFRSYSNLCNKNLNAKG